MSNGLKAPHLGVGIQLILWGEELVADAPRVFAQCADLNYDYVEAPLAVLSVPPSLIADAAKRSGIPLHAIHVGFQDVAAEHRLREILAYAEQTGTRKIISSGVADSATPTGYEEAARRFNHVGKLCCDVGVQFYYHSHWWEFVASDDNIRGMDILLSRTAPELVAFNLDICWTQAAFSNPVQTIVEMSDRCNYYHIKNARIGLECGKIKTWLPLGEGDVDVAGCVRTALVQPGPRYLVVEQDEPRYYASPEGEARASRMFLASMGI